MRLEKGYRAWGSDITPETTPEAAGLGFAVRIDKPTPFLGRDALLPSGRPAGPRERLRCLVLDDPRAVCLGGEPVRIDGATAGRVTSGGYGYRVGAASRTPTFLSTARARHRGRGRRLRRPDAGERSSASRSYDPENARIRS